MKSHLVYVSFLCSFILIAGCSFQQEVTQTERLSGSDDAPQAITMSNSEWSMEGLNPRRDRSSIDNISPPLRVNQEFSIGGDTRLGSPVHVSNGLLFMEGDHRLHALSVEEGEERWFFNLPGSYVSPAVVDNSVFVRAEAGDDGFIMALQADTGLKLWQYKFPSVGSPYNNIGGHVTSPVVVGGLVLVGANRSFRALDAQTGNEVWKYDTDEPIASSATITEGTVYFSNTYHIFAVDLQTGEERWTFETGAVTPFFAAVIIENQIIVTGQKVVYALDHANGELLWQIDILEDVLIPAGASQDHIYIKSVNNLYAIERLTGEENWSYRATDFVSLPAISGEQIYIIARTEGVARLQALNRTDGKEVWGTDNARLANAAPVIAHNQIYVRTIDGSVITYHKAS